MEKLVGKTELRIVGQGISAVIIKLYPYSSEDTAITTDEIFKLLSQNKITYGIDKQAINYFVEKCINENCVISDITIANAKLPTKSGIPYLKFSKSPYDYDNTVIWSMLEKILKDTNTNLSGIPYSMVFHKKDEVIANSLITSEIVNGKNIYGEEIPAARYNLGEYYAGENVRFDEAKKVFIAGISGYLLIKDTTISIISPFLVSKDKMELLFYHYKSTTNEAPTHEDVLAYLTKNKIAEKNLINIDLSSTPPENVDVIARGTFPEESTDAQISYHYETANKLGSVNENGQIDFREILTFSDVKENQVLATKTLPVRGTNGEDLFGGAIASRNPKDLGIKCGLNTFKEESDFDLKIISSTEGIVDNKNGIISVFPQLKFNSDIDYNTGNIHTKVNVYITGTVKTGFTVQSEKNIFINGSVEDSCIIEAGGDIYIQNGVTGQNSVLTAGGNLSIKFMEGCKFNVKGNVNVQRFMMSVNGECGDSIFVMGASVNLNERGAIVDCDLKVRNGLVVPTIGNEAGTKSRIEFGYDGPLNNKIANLKDAVDKLKEQINTLNDQFEVDITSPNIHTIIKNFAKSVKDDIIEAIQEKNKLESKMNMMQGMLDKELETKKALLEKSCVQFTKKVLPLLILDCDGVTKSVDSLQPPSKYYLDMETHWIERTRY